MYRAMELNHANDTAESSPERRYPKRNRVRRFDIAKSESDAKTNDADEEANEKMDFLYSWYKVSVAIRSSTEQQLFEQH